MIARRGVAGFALAAAGYGCTIEASGFAAKYATPSSENSTPPPPAPLGTPPSFPHRYDGYSVGVGAHLGHPDLYGYDKVEISIASSTGDERPLSFGDASFVPHGTALVSILAFAGVGWLSYGWNFELGLAPFTLNTLSRRLDETDGHGHVFSPTQFSANVGIAAEANTCHRIVDVSSEWQVQMCGYLEPSTTYDGTTGIAGGIRVRLGHVPLDMGSSSGSEESSSSSCDPLIPP